MTTMPVALDAALSADRMLIYGSVEINLPNGDVRLLDGSGYIVVDGKAFAGEDANFGVLDSIDPIDDGLGDDAPALSIKLLPASGAAVGILASPTYQGSRVRVRLGAVDRASGLSIGEQILFDGEIDVPILEVGMHARSLELDCVSAFERFFEVNEGLRLSDSYQQNVWPGETGLINTTGLETTLTWGSATAITSGSNTSSVSTRYANEAFN